MSNIFISYSRRDLGIAQRIVDALTKINLDVWIDWNSIPKGEDWEQEIYRGIEEAEVFLFLVSADSVSSEMCNKEILHALKNSKRILPVFVGDVENRQVYGVLDKFLLPSAREEIGKRNFIYCRDGRDDFEHAIAEIQKTINTDYEWVKFHTELQRKALRWDRKKDFSRLMIGKDLREAETQLAEAGKKDPQPSKLQREYVVTSRKFARRLTFVLTSLAALVVIVITAQRVIPYVQMERAIPGKWVSIPAGSFTMGMDSEEAKVAYELCTKGALNQSGVFCDDEKKLLDWSGRQVHATLEKFQIMDNEVTNAQYKQCMDAGKCRPHTGWSFTSVEINKPASDLTWQEATLFCQWLGGRLPTEGEWEKAARGPDHTIFPWGDTWKNGKANLKQGDTGGPLSIAAYASIDTNAYHVSNMAGNVKEFTASEYSSTDPSSKHAEGSEFANHTLQLKDIATIDWVIYRGGSYYDTSDYGMGSHRATWRSADHDPLIGFRCACPPKTTCNSPWDWKWIWGHTYYPAP